MRFILAAALAFLSSLAGAEPTKTILNPFTGKFDFITQLSSGTLPPGSTYYLSVSSPIASGSMDINGKDAAGYSLKLSSGISMPNGCIILSGGQVCGPSAGGGETNTYTSSKTFTSDLLVVGQSTMTGRINAAGGLYDGGNKFFDGACLSNQTLDTIDASGDITCQNISYPAEVDAVIGNEVTDATNGTLTRSGSGTGGSPYTLGLNLASTNTWSANIRTLSSMTVSGSAFSVGVTTLVVSAGNVSIGNAAPGTGGFVNISRPNHARGIVPGPALSIDSYSYRYITGVGTIASEYGGVTIGSPTITSSGVGSYSADNAGSLYLLGPPRLHTGASASSTSTILMAGVNDHKIEVGVGPIGLTGKSLTVKAGDAGVTSEESLRGGSLYLLAGNGYDPDIMGGDGGSVIIKPGTATSASEPGAVLIAPAVGNVGVGTYSPKAMLDVAGTVALRGAVTMTSTATISGNQFSVGGSTFVVAYSSVGIRTNDPQAALDVRGTVRVSTSTTDYLDIQRNGSIRFVGAPRLEIQTGKPAFCASASSLACHSFQANANGGYRYDDSNGIAVSRLRTTGEFNIGSVATGFVSTFTATGDLLVPGYIDASKSSVTASGFFGNGAGLTNVPSSSLSGGVAPGLVDLSTVTTAIGTEVRLASDVTIYNTASFSNVTGLSFTLAASSTYYFEFDVIFQSTLTTTGVGFAVNGPTSPAYVVLQTQIPISLVATTMGGARAYDSGTASSGVDTKDLNLLAKIFGMISTGTNAGTLILRAKSELLGGRAEIKAGSKGFLKRIP